MQMLAIFDDARGQCPGRTLARFTAMLLVACGLNLNAIGQVDNESPKLPAIAAAAGTPDAKADTMIIPSLEFKEAPMRQCVDFLREKSVQLDPEKKGINFVINVPETYNLTAPITLNLRNIPFREALKYVVSLGNCKYRCDPHAIVIVPMGDDYIRQKVYPLPAVALEREPEIFDHETTSYPGRFDFAPYLKQRAVTFPEGTSAVYIARTEKLLVRNTDENLELVDILVQSLTKDIPKPTSSNPTQAKLERIIFPRLELQETQLHEAIDFLEKRIREMSPDGTGVKLQISGEAEPNAPLITIRLSDIPALDALNYVSLLGNRKCRVAANDRVIIEPLNAVVLLTKQYRVPANSISTREGTVKGPDGVTYPNVYEFFTAFGVTFPEGASAGLPIDGEAIAMRNTQTNLNISDAIVKALTDAAGEKLSDDDLTVLRDQIEQLRAEGR